MNAPSTTTIFISSAFLQVSVLLFLLRQHPSLYPVANMPKLTKGIYTKCGYADDMHVGDLVLHFLASGCTRQVYSVESMPNAIAKVMPSSKSRHWRKGYDQNTNEYLVKGSGIFRSTTGLAIRRRRAFREHLG